MAITYSIDRAAGIVCITLGGSSSFQDFTDHFKEIGADPQFTPDMDRLVVIQDDASFPTGVEISGLAPEIRARGQGFTFRIAVVCPDPVPGGITKLAVLSGVGERLVFFPESTAALGWLVAGKKSAEQTSK